MTPLVGSSKPAIIMSVVVLPEPLGPRNVTNSPRAMSTLMSSTALTRPSYDFTSRCSRRYDTGATRSPLRARHDEGVHDHATRASRSHHDGIDVELVEAVTLGPGEVGEGFEAARERGDVARRPTPEPGQHRCRARLRDHRRRIALAQRQRAEGHVVERLDQDSAGPERQHEPEVGVALHPREDLEDTTRHLLDHEAVHGVLPPEVGQPARYAVPLGAELGVVTQADRHEPEVGAVRD